MSFSFRCYTCTIYAIVNCAKYAPKAITTCNCLQYAYI